MRGDDLTEFLRAWSGI